MLLYRTGRKAAKHITKTFSKEKGVMIAQTGSKSEVSKEHIAVSPGICRTKHTTEVVSAKGLRY